MEKSNNKGIYQWKFFTSVLLMFLLCLTGKSQTSGFKILNSDSQINTSEKTSIEKKSGKKEEVYKTPSIIKYNYITHKIKPLLIDLANNESDLYNNSLEIDSQKRYSEKEIEKRFNDIQSIKKTLKNLYKEQDSLYQRYTSEYLLNDKGSLNSFVLEFGRRRSKAFFDHIYNVNDSRFKVLNNTGFTFGNNSASLYSELVSGYLGAFRVSLGTVLSKSSSDIDEVAKKEEAFQRLASYGGNTVLSFEYPLALFHCNGGQFNLASRFIAKGTADFPEFGTTTEDFAGSGSLGIDFIGDAALSNNELRFFMNFNINGIVGNDTYKENLDIKNSSFYFGQLTLGLLIAEKIKLSFIISSFSSENNLENNSVILGGQVLH